MRKTKKVYNANINEKEVADNRKIGNTVKPFLLDEVISQEKFTLVKNSKIITQDTKIADGLNLFFANVVTFNVPASRLIHDFFLSKRQQRTKINDDNSLWEEVIFRVSQGSVVGAILFNIFLR